MDDCTKAAALADFLLWSQTDALALRNAVRFAFSLFPSLRRFVLSLTGRTTHTTAVRQGFVLPTASDEVNRSFMRQLRAFTCAGQPVSALANCITDDGQLCSGQGTCTNNACACDSGREGLHCESATSASSSDSTIAILGTPPHTRTRHTTHEHFRRTHALTLGCRSDGDSGVGGGGGAAGGAGDRGRGAGAAQGER
jgi:hypothetical protein